MNISDRGLKRSGSSIVYMCPENVKHSSISKTGSAWRTMSSTEVRMVSVCHCKHEGSAPGACEVAGAARDERDCQGLAQHGQAAALPEAVHQRRHPGIVAHRDPQVPTHARRAMRYIQASGCVIMPPVYAFVEALPPAFCRCRALQSVYCL